MTLGATLAAAAAAEIGLAVVMAGAWLVQRLTGASGWIDAIWTFGVGLAGVALAFGFGGTSGGAAWRVVLVASLAAAWSLRLGAHIVARTLKAGDDLRYRRLVEDWGDRAQWRLFAFLQVQAVAGAVLALAVGLAASSAATTPRIQDALGVPLFAAAFVGEAVADAQIARFKANPANRAGICEVGLWRFTRHPNYFFEWLTWVAFTVLAVDENWIGWLAVLAPTLMYWTLRYASGVPLLEQHMLRSRGEAFRAYQARTLAFFPWFPRK
jgi:steroid 5-alpha reductase family enzyme